jgi:hypothetical protein
LEIIFSRLDVQHLYSIEGSVVLAFTQGDNSDPPPKNALTKPILATSLTSRKEGEAYQSLSNVRLNCLQSAFSLVSAILVKIEAPELFFQKFLFSEDLEKGDHLWNTLIDLEVCFFLLIIETILFRRKWSYPLFKLSQHEKEGFYGPWLFIVTISI